jgi:hypothetical protein
MRSVQEKPRVVLNVGQRMELITASESEPSHARLAERFKVCEKTVERILSRGRFEGIDPSRKRPVRITRPDVEKELLTFFEQQRTMGNPVTYSHLEQYGARVLKRLSDETGVTMPPLSVSFIREWCKRNCICFSRFSGERASADTEGATKYRASFADQIKDIEPCYLFNADETCVFLKQGLKATLTREDERRPAGKRMCKDRATVLVCANATGTCRIPLLILGRAQKPRCLNGEITCPFVYKSTPNGWMDTKTFNEWVLEVFWPHVVRFCESRMQTPRAGLVLDNHSSHGSLPNVQGIRAIYLPPNTTSLLQPMDHGVIAALKKRYKTAVSNCMFQQCNGPLGQMNEEHFFKAMDLSRTGRLLATCWSAQVTPSTLQNAWRPLLDGIPSGESDHEDDQKENQEAEEE